MSEAENDMMASKRARIPSSTYLSFQSQIGRIHNMKNGTFDVGGIDLRALKRGARQTRGWSIRKEIAFIHISHQLSLYWYTKTVNRKVPPIAD